MASVTTRSTSSPEMRASVKCSRNLKGAISTPPTGGLSDFLGNGYQGGKINHGRSDGTMTIIGVEFGSF